MTDPTPPGLTCCRCGQSLYGYVARRTEDGWRHAQSLCPRFCSVEGCERKHQARGFCQTHYLRNRAGERGGPRRVLTPDHLEDVEWMAETGESWAGALTRLGITGSTLERFLYRHDRADLVAALKGREVAVA